MDARVIVDGIEFGEAPRWHDGRLWFSDFFGHVVRAVTPDGDVEVVVGPELLGERQPSGLGWLPDGDLLIVSMVDRRVLRWDGIELREHADLSRVAAWHCNDMVVAANGDAYVGNFGFELGVGEPAPADLALVRPDGTVEVAATDLLFPNGSVITADGSTLVVAETFGGRFTAFDIGTDGTLGERRTWATVAGFAPDGCCLDAEGGIWFAHAGQPEVVRVVEGGAITDRRQLSKGTYACMLGGDDGRTLFVLTALGHTPGDGQEGPSGRLEALEVDVPRAGRP